MSLLCLRYAIRFIFLSIFYKHREMSKPQHATPFIILQNSESVFILHGFLGSCSYLRRNCIRSGLVSYPCSVNYPEILLDYLILSVKPPWEMLPLDILFLDIQNLRRTRRQMRLRTRILARCLYWSMHNSDHNLV